MSNSSLRLGEPDPLDDVDAIVGVVPLVAGVALHRVGGRAMLSISRQSVTPFSSAWATIFLNPSTQFFAPDVGRDVLGEAGEADHLLEAVRGAGVDGVPGGLDDPVVILGVVEPLDERRVGPHVDRARWRTRARPASGAGSTSARSARCSRSRAAWRPRSSRGTSQYFSKHQWTIDCLIRPFLDEGPSSAAAAAMDSGVCPSTAAPRRAAPVASSRTRLRARPLP